MERKLITKKTFVLILALLFLSVGVFFLVPKEKGESVEIWVDGKLHSEHFLKSKFSEELDNGVKIVCDGQSAFFEHSDCPDKVCINTGKLSLVGQWAACLPNSTVIKITGENGKADTVS